MKKSAGGFLAVCCLFLLLSHPSLSLTGARQGLLLWADTVLPTLLPFMLCTGVIVAFNGISLLTLPFKPILTRFFSLSEQGSFCLICGLLCGYPMGAKMTNDFVESGRISPTEGKYLLAISSFPSPMFILGYMASQAKSVPLSPMWPSWSLAASIYIPILPLSFLAKKIYGAERSSVIEKKEPIKEGSFSFDSYLIDSFEIMVKIGGYIMLFSILALYLSRLPIPTLFRCAFLGGVEMTTGIAAICSQVSGRAGLMLTAAAGSFGGLSGLFQTKSVLKNARLSIWHYMWWKLLSSLLSFLLLYGLSELL